MTQMQKTMAVFSGSVNPSLADGIAKELGLSLGNVKLEKFANGEIYARYGESVRGADVFIVQSVSAGSGYDVNDALMELLIMIDAAKRASARSVCAVISHYGYARQERKAAPREPITARLVADLITSAGANRIIAIDLHQDAIQGFFNLPFWNGARCVKQHNVVIADSVGKWAAFFGKKPLSFMQFQVSPNQVYRFV